MPGGTFKDGSTAADEAEEGEATILGAARVTADAGAERTADAGGTTGAGALGNRLGDGGTMNGCAGTLAVATEVLPEAGLTGTDSVRERPTAFGKARAVDVGDGVTTPRTIGGVLGEPATGSTCMAVGGAMADAAGFGGDGRKIGKSSNTSITRRLGVSSHMSNSTTCRFPDGVAGVAGEGVFAGASVVSATTITSGETLRFGGGSSGGGRVSNGRPARVRLSSSSSCRQPPSMRASCK